MPTLYEMGNCSVNHHELAFIREDGIIDVWCFGYQPTTNDIADRAMRRPSIGPRYTHVVQKIGNMFEVYDLSTLKRHLPRGSDFTIGMPVAVNEDVDAAIMAALLTS